MFGIFRLARGASFLPNVEPSVLDRYCDTNSSEDMSDLDRVENLTSAIDVVLV